MQMPCPNCGALNRPQAKACSTCGQSLLSSPVPVGGAPPTAGISSGGKPCLVAADGQVYILHSPAVTIGREACDIMFTADGRVSRRHAQVEQTASGWQIVDLGSSNGTFVNGLKLTSQACPLTPGDQIVVGDTVLTFAPPTGQPVLPTPLRVPPVASPWPTPVPGAQSQPFPPAGPPVQWRQWPYVPQVEGRVAYIDPTSQPEQKPMWGRFAAAGILALIFSPLAFFPFVGRHEVPVRNMRVEDRHTGNLVGVRIRGDMIGSINTGDAVAVWTRTKRGVVEMVRAHNYTTDQPVNVKG